jgi:transcriptional regulator with XRE-family HTH domain
LPFCRLRLQAKRTDPRLPKKLRTLGDHIHIRKRRIELGLRQRDVADLLRADPQSVNAWERNYRQPSLRLLPAIRAFLGYDLENVPDNTPLGLRIASKRRRLELSQKALGESLGIDEGTVGKWERGESQRRPNLRVRRVVQRWLANSRPN